MKATITLGDLPREEQLDRKARLAIRGGKSGAYEPGDSYDSFGDYWQFQSPYPAPPFSYGRHKRYYDPYSPETATSPAFLGV